MSETPSIPAASPPLRSAWQFPLLLASAAMLVAGFVRIVPRAPEPDVDEELAGLSRMVASGQGRTAYDSLIRIHGLESLSERQRGEAARLLATVVYGTARGPRGLEPAAAEQVRRYLDEARQCGHRLDRVDALRLAEACDGLGDRSAAVVWYRAALDAGARPAAPIHRRLAALLELDKGADEARMEWHLDALLTAPDVSAADRYWAVQRRMNRLLARGDAAAGERLLEQATRLLAGTGYAADVMYERARLLSAAGRPEEADRLLREMRNQWAPRDDLWARAGVLLAHLEHVDGRPESALALYDEIQRVHLSGPRNVEAALASVECLFELERYEEAAGVMKRVISLLRAGGSGAEVSPEVVRAMLLGMSNLLAVRGLPADGLRFLRLVEPLGPFSDADQEAAYLKTRADLCTALAEQEAATGKAADDRAAGGVAARRRSALFREAGEAYERLAVVKQLDEATATLATWAAADAYEAAGDVDRCMKVLAALVEDRPISTRRGEALARLGQMRRARGDIDGAIAAYEQVLREYPRTPAALRSLVPLADCLICSGGESAARGERLLVRVVDGDEGRDSLIEPGAPEHADALFRLSEVLVDRGWNEQAIVRLEMFDGLYPEDPRIPECRFLLATAYRRSGKAVAADRGLAIDKEEQERLTAEAYARLERAAALYAGLTAHDPAATERLGEIERARQCAAWLSRADCLFDMERYAEARDVYSEVAWRYDNQQAATAAMLQIVHCHLRLGQPAEARAALARLALQIRKTPDEAFAARPGSPTKQYWQETVERLSQSGLF